MSTTDPAAPGRWLESQRRSRRRRLEAARRLRRLRGRRSLAGALIASLALAAGGAVAQERAPGNAAPAARSLAAVQAKLGIPADGVNGPRTRRAVRRFQRANGLTVDSVVGPQTLAALGLGSGARAGTNAPSPEAGATAGDAAALARIAECESGGNPAAVSANGRYRGKYQFSRATWRLLGGGGDPAEASEAEQDRMAAKLYSQRGTAPWPACGRA